MPNSFLRNAFTSYRPFLMGLGLVVLALAAFVPAFSGPEIWDDKDWLTNAYGLYAAPNALWRIWTDPGSVQQYYPVTTTSFWLDYLLWGAGRTGPLHVENAFLHGLSAVGFWILLSRLGLRHGWFAAALFAVHPMMAESVAWITERKNVLCTLFGILALFGHGSAVGWWASKGKGTLWMHGLAFGAFSLAMLSKVGAVTLIGVVLVLSWWRTGSLEWRRHVLPLFPWLAVSIPLILITGRLETDMVLKGDITSSLPWLDRIVLAGQLPWIYLTKLIWPSDLRVFYTKWALDAGVWWHWAGLAGIAMLFALCFRSNKRGALALMLIFLGTLFPLLGIFTVNGFKYAWLADRWCYVPAMAVFAAAGLALDWVPLRAIRVFAVTTTLFILTALCRQRSALYADVDVFWQDAISRHDAPWKAHNDYGSQLMDMHSHAEAVRQFRKALEVKPDYAGCYVNLANALEAMGLREDALRHLEKALELQPEHNSIIHYNKAIVLERLGRTEEALSAYSRAHELKPDFTAAWNDRGNLLLLNRRYEEALQCFRHILEVEPFNAKARTSVGNVHFFQSQHAPALEAFKQAIAIEPELVSALTNCAWIMSTSGDGALRNGPEALRLARKAAKLTMFDDPSILQVLAAAYAESGDFEAAVEVSKQGQLLAQRQGKTGLAESIRASEAEFAQERPYRSQ